MAFASPKNYTLGKFASCKQLIVPISIVGGAASVNTVVSADDEVQDAIEIFSAQADAAADGLRNGVALAVGSLLDPSANDVNGKAFASAAWGLKNGVFATGALATYGFIIADGETQLQPSNIPLPGDGKNPTYGVPQVIGSARKLIAAALTLQDQSAAGLTVVEGVTLRAQTLTTGVTPNGNLQFAVSFKALPLTGPVTYRGFLEVWYL